MFFASNLFLFPTHPMKNITPQIIIRKEKFLANESDKMLDLTAAELKEAARKTKFEYMTEANAHPVLTFIEVEE